MPRRNISTLICLQKKHWSTRVAVILEVSERRLPAALWTDPFLRYLLVVGCSHGWDHKWPDNRESEWDSHWLYWIYCSSFGSEILNNDSQMRPKCFFLHLSSLGDLACGEGLFLSLYLPIPGFLHRPLPGQHGFDWFLDGPTINFLVLKARKV